ncbi:hypothetical protein COO60DRAFT_1704001 [Scenedesmus sp. NREL 46B-D3]|nr:hypothetical protein COO60DRAFT_1704001 [Scenedesmus sp. NREL 46B-D3]
MAAADESFVAKTKSIFDRLGDAGGWQLNTAQGFRPGAEERDSSEEEDEARAPQSLPGAVGSDDEAAEEERSYRAHASCAYVRAFEAEPEEDDFDRQAAGGSSSRAADEASGTAPDCGGRVDGCAWRRQMRHMEYKKQQQQQQQQQQEQQQAAGSSSSSSLPSGTSLPLGKCGRRGLITGGQTAAAGVRVCGAAPAEENGQQPQQQHSEPQDKQQQQQQQRRVRFADAGAGAGARSGEQQALQGHYSNGWGGSSGRGSGARSGRGGRGRSGRGSFVPDHVRNPQKYTVYTLDEPLFVGQGGGDEAAADGRPAAAAVAAAGTGAAAAVQHVHIRLPAEQQASAHEWGTAEDAPMVLDAPPPVPVAAAASVPGVDAEAAAASEPPTAGVIKFQPSKRICKDAEAAGKPGAAAAAARGGFLQDEDLQDEDKCEQPAAASGAALAGAGKARKGSRQYRSRHQQED